MNVWGKRMVVFAREVSWPFCHMLLVACYRGAAPIDLACPDSPGASVRQAHGGGGSQVRFRSEHHEDRVHVAEHVPRCWLGGSGVMVASRPPSATARIALAAPPRAALTTAATPWPPVIVRTCSGHSWSW